MFGVEGMQKLCLLGTVWCIVEWAQFVCVRHNVVCCVVYNNVVCLEQCDLCGVCTNCGCLALYVVCTIYVCLAQLNVLWSLQKSRVCSTVWYVVEYAKCVCVAQCGMLWSM